MNKATDVLIIGAGAAGIGTAIILQKMGVPYAVLERHSIGASFKKWAAETRFISPSFTGNFFKVPDLNAISPDTSPAFSLQTEHPNGLEYAEYLTGVAEHYGVPVETGVEVKEVKKEGDAFHVETDQGTYEAKHVIWAGGEYQYPSTDSFEGSELCTHYATINSYNDLIGDEFVIIGGYEAGFDAAVNLVKIGKNVTVIDSDAYLDLVVSDSSYGLAPFTRDRIKEAMPNITYHKETKVTKVSQDGDTYTIELSNGETLTSKSKPLDCTGFASSLSLVEDLFEFDDDYPVLNDVDMSSKTENLYLVGPQVKHGNALFCFIYKYRQRFAIVAEAIANNLGIDTNKIQEVLQEYKDNSFYLVDLSCCEEECPC